MSRARLGIGRAGSSGAPRPTWSSLHNTPAARAALPSIAPQSPSYAFPVTSTRTRVMPDSPSECARPRSLSPQPQPASKRRRTLSSAPRAPRVVDLTLESDDEQPQATEEMKKPHSASPAAVSPRHTFPFPSTLAQRRDALLQCVSLVDFRTHRPVPYPSARSIHDLLQLDVYCGLMPEAHAFAPPLIRAARADRARLDRARLPSLQLAPHPPLIREEEDALLHAGPLFDDAQSGSGESEYVDSDSDSEAGGVSEASAGNDNHEQPSANRRDRARRRIDGDDDESSDSFQLDSNESSDEE